MKFAKDMQKTFLLFHSNKNRSLKHMASAKYIDKIQHYYWHTQIIFDKQQVFSNQYEIYFFRK